MNYAAQNYTEIIDWDDVELFEPIFTTSMASVDLEAICETKLLLPKFPIHTQSVERGVKLVTEASRLPKFVAMREGMVSFVHEFIPGK